MDPCPAENCDGSGWHYDRVMGWIACADCNDDAQKTKPAIAPMFCEDVN